MRRLVSARSVLNVRLLSNESRPEIQVFSTASEPSENISPRRSATRDFFNASSKDRVEISGFRTLPKAQSLGEILIPAKHTPAPSPGWNTRTNWDYVRAQNRPSAFASVLAKREIDKAPSFSGSSANPGPPSARNANVFQSTNGGNRHAPGTGFSPHGRTDITTRRNQQDIRGDMHRSSGFNQRSRDDVARKGSSRPHERNGEQRSEARRGLNQRTDRSLPRKDMRQSPRSDRSPVHRANSSNPNTYARDRGSLVSDRLPALPLAVELQDTKLSELFSSMPNKDTPAALRAQSTLENAGGDYSRYLPEELKGGSEILSPTRHAQLVLARSRDVGLQGRNRIMRIVKSSVGESSEANI